jgi:hypothetical protein
MNERKISLNMFWFSLLLTAIASLVVQLLLVPSIAVLNGGNGLLSGGDAIGYHAVAVALVEQMQMHGWSAWELRPNTWGPSGIAAAFYYSSGINEPYVLIPMSCLLYSGAVYLFSRTAFMISASPWYWISVLPLLLFPSSLIIYAQVSKDIYTFFGLSIFFYLLVSAAKGIERPVFPVKYTLLIIVACLSIWIGRPYLLKVAVASLAGTYVLMVGWSLIQRRGIPVLLMALLIFVPLTFSILSFDDKGVLVDAPAIANVTLPPTQGGILGKVLGTVNFTRQSFLAGYKDAGSNLDQDVLFNSYTDALMYIPRGLLVGFAAPFPQNWFQHAAEKGGNMMRVVSAFEMTLAYISYIGLALFVFNPRLNRYAAAVVLLFCTGFIIVHVFFIPNAGTLYRIRYPYWQMAISLGVLGWIGLWEWRGSRLTRGNRGPRSDQTQPRSVVDMP